MKASLAACVSVSLLVTAASAHDAHVAAGAPGNPAASARTVDIAVRELPDGTMRFGTDAIRAAPGEQIRFVVRNDGKARHEFRIDSAAGNAAHKEMMARMPDMAHHDDNAITLAPGAVGSLVWRFPGSGTFEFACLVPGHYEAGMHGTVTVAKAAR